MAPWPAQGNEPKAPDRNKTTDNRTLDSLKSKSEPPEDKKLIKGISKEDQSELTKKDVHSLDDGQLKALLDEAIQYKNPKDREGKSKIFRELLQKVEADDSDCSYPVVGVRGSGVRRALRLREGSKGIAISERSSRGGSLQNIFHASSSSEFDTHHSGGARKKNKRQGPGSSVSARQREGGSLPSNVNAGWPLESWQSDQTKKKSLFDRDSQQPSHVTVNIGNTAYSNSSSVAIASTQSRRQTLKHSASNELPSSKKPSSGELYPLRRHHSSSDQSKSFEPSMVKLKNQSENSSSAARKMPQLPKPSECVSFDMSSLNLEIKKLSDSDPSLSLEKKLQGFQSSDKYRITSCEVESEKSGISSQEVFTTRASLEVEPVDSSIELGFNEKRVLNGMESVQLSDNYPSVQCIVGDRSRISDAANQAHVNDQSFGLRPHMYRNLNMNMNMIVNISSKSSNDSPRTDENGNALSVPSLTSRVAKKNQKRKSLAEKNVVFSEDIAGYRGNKDIDDILKFIESDKAKNKQIKKLTKGKKHEKKRQNMQKSTSLEEMSQRNIDDLTESSESERTSVRKSRMGANAEENFKERRRWGDQGFIKSGSQNDLSMEQGDENNSDSDFQMVTKKQRKRKVNDPNPKRVRNHRNSRRSPRRKSTSSVPPSERSGDSDLDSVHSLPVGAAPTASYADIAAGNANYFNSKAISEMSTLNGDTPEKAESVSAVKTNEIEKWCNSVNQHWDKTKYNNMNNNNNNININNKNNNGNSPNNKNNGNNNNNNQNTNNQTTINHTNINSNSDLKNCCRLDNRKQNVDVDVNENCDNNVKKLKDLVIVDKSIDNKVATSIKFVDVPMKNDLKQVASSCDSDQCKIVNSKSNEAKKTWNRKNFSREDFPCLPVKSTENTNTYQKNKDISEENAFGKTKQYSYLVRTQGDLAETAATPKKPRSEEEGRHRRSNRSRSMGPNTRPPVILLQDERTKDSTVCEITFGFEVNEQLLTSDDSTLLLEEETEGADETSSNKSGDVVRRDPGETGEAPREGEPFAAVNGNLLPEKEASKSQSAFVGSSKALLDGVTNSTLQELFKRHETMSGPGASASSGSPTPSVASGTSMANKYVPPVTPVQFNFDKIVTFVGSAWEDVMKNGKIQYYTGDN